MIHFAFLQTEWPTVFEAAAKAKEAVLCDPRTACFYARRSLELVIAWLFKHDPSLKLPYQDNLSALIHEPNFKTLVGMDRQAAKEALADFLSGKTLGGNQIEFVNLIVNHLTEHGVMAAALLYESPFTDITPQGPDGLFTSAQVDELLMLLEDVQARAVA